jgi:hypothetical protein
MLSLETPSGVREAIALLDQASIVTDQILAARRMVIRRARVLHCSSLIPVEWSKVSLVAASGEIDLPAHEQVLRAKAAASGTDADILRRAYIEGTREYAMLPKDSRPPFTRDAYAQSRVNAAIREQGI